jgi:alcohol dehydrogenase class IV
MKRGQYNFLSQDKVIFGVPTAEAVLQEADRLGAKRVFIVTSKSLNRNTQAIADIAKALGSRHAGTFDGCIAHTPRASVIAAAEAARAAKPDLVVTIGGGTAIDTVNVMLVCLAEGVRDVDAMGKWHVQVNPDGTRNTPTVKDPPFRQIVVPTTLSGAEFSNLGGCTDPTRKIKDAYTARHIGALSVILDPAITVHTPEWLWLSTGIRAVDHAVEGICSSEAQPFTDATQLHALRLFRTSLPRNKQQPDDLDARLDSQIAVWLASTGINRIPYGASHGIGHALGGAADVPHGYTSCVMLPAVLRYNLPATREKQKMISEAFGRPNDSAADCVSDLIKALGQPQRLRDVGLKREQFDDVARAAMHNIWVRTNPQPIRSEADVKAILETVW